MAIIAMFERLDIYISSTIKDIDETSHDTLELIVEPYKTALHYMRTGTIFACY